MESQPSEEPLRSTVHIRDAPADIRVFPQQEKASVPMRKSMVVCRNLQSWLTVAMKCRVMYS